MICVSPNDLLRALSSSTGSPVRGRAHAGAPWPAALRSPRWRDWSLGTSRVAASQARAVMRRASGRSPPPIASSTIGMAQVSGDDGSNVARTARRAPMRRLAAVRLREIGVRQHHVDALDDEDEAGDQQQADHEAQQIGRDEVLASRRPCTGAHASETRPPMPSRHEQHDEHEDQALIEQPGSGEIGGDAREEGHDRRAERRAEERARAADERLQHDVGRGLGAKIV